MRYPSLKTVLILLLAVQFAPGLAEETPGLESLTGIPVMAGLQEDLSERVVFDKAEGRIVFAQFSGSVSKNDVINFYRETLFQLGWVLDYEGRENDRVGFTRENEELIITITRTEPLEVTVALRPTS